MAAGPSACVPAMFRPKGDRGDIVSDIASFDEKGSQGLARAVCERFRYLWQRGRNNVQSCDVSLNSCKRPGRNCIGRRNRSHIRSFGRALSFIEGTLLAEDALQRPLVVM